MAITSAASLYALCWMLILLPSLTICMGLFGLLGWATQRRRALASTPYGRSPWTWAIAGYWIGLLGTLVLLPQFHQAATSLMRLLRQL